MSSIVIETTEKKPGMKIAKKFHGDASKVTLKGLGLKKAFQNRAANFNVDVTGAGTYIDLFGHHLLCIGVFEDRQLRIDLFGDHQLYIDLFGDRQLRIDLFGDHQLYIDIFGERLFPPLRMCERGNVWRIMLKM